MSPITTRPVLVTGGAGYVGAHVCKALSRNGYLPITYDNLERGHAWAVKWGPLEKGDIRDKARLAEAFTRWRPEAVLHFASYCYVGESMERLAEYYDNNVVGSLTLLNAMRAHDVRRIVFSSTCAVYGLPHATALDENHPREPVNPYGQTKRLAEDMLRDFCRTYGLHATVLRYFNAAGADPENEIGETHDPEPHLIPRLIAAGLGKLDRVEIFGRDYDTPDGTCVRDYVDVTDLADAHLAALRLEGDGFSAINLGSGQGASILEVIAATENVIGRQIPAVDRPRRAGDPDRLVADVSRAARVLGWKPVRSDLKTILETATAWARRSS